jgi:archaellum biogenesis ATPase FlaH
MNEYSIRKTFEALQKQDEPIEVRIVSGKATFSGYFRDVDNLIEKLKPFDKVNTANIYFVLNKINDDCYDRQQCEMFIQNPKQTTSDSDIVHRDWLLIDVDPVRSAGVSASDKEKANAKNVANAVYSYLKSKGFAKPISCDSGNGWHLLYKIRMANDESARDTIKKFLQTLDMMFSDETAQIDTSVFNAARITKLYGTIARKGNNSKTRPHRESGIIRIPDEVLVNRKALLQKVIDELPQPEAPTYKNNYNKEPFDIDNFIARHSIPVSKIVNYGLGRKFILEECIFDSNHKAPDACIFAMNNGAIGYKCFHNSCQRYTWKDVRVKFEPDAYDKKEREYTKQRTTKPTGTTIAELIGKAKPTDEEKVFVQMSEIEAVDRSQLVTIPSGFTELDKKIIGFNKGEISLWSGRNGSAKSTVLNQICLNACQDGFKCAIFSGELTKQRIKQWIQLQAAGRQNVSPSKKYENLFYVPQQTGEKIDKWLDDKLWIYDNAFGNKFENVLNYLKELVEKKNIDMIVLDNLMALDILTLNGDKYQQQTTMILALVDFVKTYNVHLHIVCHPRKAATFLRKDDISGTADLTNAVDNVFIIHRVGNDFVQSAKDFYGDAYASKFYGFGNVIEVCKNRDLGIMDELFGFFFETQSKRLLNDAFENVCYGWEESPTRFFSEEKMQFVSFTELPFDVDEEWEDGDLPY